MISPLRRKELVEARGEEYRAGVITEAQFRAYLFGMRYRGEDITHTMNEYTPAPRQTFEEARMEASRQWLRDRAAPRHSWGDPIRPDANNTRRTCKKCGMVKITRHESDNVPQHWVEYEMDGRRVDTAKTPACDGGKARG